ncbi:MAG TPA: tetratricopeptide repeat protein [Burkholderiales bacterium]|nr:tetratricopeptide repeat protein [Burkholderiales bacterium]
MPSQEADHWRAQAARLRQQGKLAEAEAACRKALQLARDDAHAWSELAHNLRWQGRLAEAHEAATTAVRLDPQLATGWFNLGAALAGQGEALAGIDAYRKALALKPDFAEAWSNLGTALGTQGDRAEEIGAYRRALRINPDLAIVWSNLSTALREAGEIDEAVKAGRRAVELDPGLSGGWTNLGNALRDSGAWQEAIEAYETALRLAPGLAPAWTGLGNVFQDMERFEEASRAHQKAVELQPDSPQLLFNLGLTLRFCGRSAEAVACYRRAIELKPDPQTQWNLGLALLILGELKDGWEQYEWRWRRSESEARRYDFAGWDGVVAASRRLLLWAEQGVGDQIIFGSMAAELAATPLTVTLEVDPRLVPLFQRSIPRLSVVARQEPPALCPADYDCQTPIASLGRWLRTSFESFPQHSAYLQPDPSRVAHYRERLRASLPGARIIVGVSWHSANRELGKYKSLALADWLPLLQTRGAGFVDLQYGDTAGERAALEERHGVRLEHLPDLDLFNDLDGLAALVGACDLVITVSNVTAHIAGAIGKPVWLLSPRAKGKIWYWFSGRRDSPWYRSMRIFEQQGPAEWRPVLDAVARELASLIGHQ